MITSSITDSDRWWAHSEGANGRREEVREHLRNVAVLAAHFAAPLSAEDEAYNAGLLHDLGKYGTLFQRRLEGKEKGIDHWAAGATIALRSFSRLSLGAATALAVEGHHTGLQKADPSSLKSLARRLLDKVHPCGNLRFSETDVGRFTSDGLSLRTLSRSLMDPSTTAAAMLDIRMLFSALVDADFLETEAHFGGRRRPDAESYAPLELLFDAR